MDLARATNPDLIVLGGDYVTYGDRGFVEPVAELLSPLRAPNGVFAILGNHDDDREMPAALARRGITVLKDQRTRIVIRGDGLEIAGIRFWTRRPADIGRVLKGANDPVLLLAHDPRRLTEAAALNVPAVLVRPHARRAGRAAQGSALSPAPLSHRPGIGTQAELVDFREPGNRHGLCASANQLPA